jgi:hypothetical protein
MRGKELPGLEIVYPIGPNAPQPVPDRQLRRLLRRLQRRGYTGDNCMVCGRQYQNRDQTLIG